MWLVAPANLGFAGGFRFGCDARSDTDVYLLLNNDVRLPERTIEACLELIGQDGVGIVGPTLMSARGIYPAATRLTSLFAVPRRPRRAPVQPTEAAYVTGAVLFVRAACHRLVPMDTRYFLVFEDTDLCYRMRHAGWRVVASPHQAWHTGGGTIPRNIYSYYGVRNRIWFARIHGESWRAPLVAAWLALVVLPRNVGSDVRRRRGLVRVPFMLHGLLDGIGPLPPANTPLTDEPRAARWERGWERASGRAAHRPPSPSEGGETPGVAVAAEPVLAQAGDAP